MEGLQSNQGLELVKTKLANDDLRRSIEFLAAICYHHYHGPVENQAFNELEKRGTKFENVDRDFIGSTLMYLLKHHQMHWLQ